MSRSVRHPIAKGRPRASGAIAYLRFLHGFTQLDLARKMNCPRTYISKIEHDCEPNIETLVRIAAAFDMPLRNFVLVSQSREAKIFSCVLSREIARKMPLCNGDLAPLQWIYHHCKSSYLAAHSEKQPAA